MTPLGRLDVWTSFIELAENSEQLPVVGKGRRDSAVEMSRVRSDVTVQWRFKLIIAIW